jgi:hypothetical protein
MTSGLARLMRPHDENRWGIRMGFFGPPLYKRLKHIIPEVFEFEPSTIG